jgi:NADH-quinone oxidoreductase subunit H
MSLAWKIMLPLGMVNLVALAVFYEIRANISGGEGWGYEMLQAAASWVVCALAWFAVAYLRPLVTDNRARRDLNPYGIDSQV